MGVNISAYFAIQGLGAAKMIFEIAIFPKESLMKM